MNGFIALLLTLPTAALGLGCGLLVGQLCVRWYGVSNFEGGAGYFVVGLALLGGLIALVVGIATAIAMAPQSGAAQGRTLATAAGLVLACTAVVVLLCRIGADVPPTLGGHPLVLEVEFRLPRGGEAPALQSSDLYLHVFTRDHTRHSVRGGFRPELVRREDDRWILPGEVFLFTERRQRHLAARIDGEDLPMFLLPLAARPGRAALQWSDWYPRPPASHAPWPDTQPSYRFRVRLHAPDAADAPAATDLDAALDDGADDAAPIAEAAGPR